MGSELEAIEERLKSFLEQVRYECAILERIVHKNKNQHRRCRYFQYLLKVRRDSRLLLSAKLEEILISCFQVINGDNLKQKIHLLESLKSTKQDGGKPNFMEQLRGAARLLSQATEPMLKAAEEVSILLAKKFFVDFSITALAVIGRLRVLAQQILLDAVSVFNMVSSLSRETQSIKLTQEGIEIFSEYYPMNRDYVILECVWESDKFVLLETMVKSEPASEVRDLDKTNSLAELPMRYESIEPLLEDEEPDLIPEVAQMKKDAHECPTYVEEDKPEPSTNSFTDDKPVEDFRNAEDNSAPAQDPGNNFSTDVGLTTASTSVATSYRKTEPKKVAFVSIKRPSPLNPTDVDNQAKKTRREDPFFDLLSSGTLRDTLF